MCFVDIYIYLFSGVLHAQISCRPYYVSFKMNRLWLLNRRVNWTCHGLQWSPVLCDREAAGSLASHSEGRLSLGRHSWAVTTDNHVLALKRERTWTKVQEEEQFESQHTQSQSIVGCRGWLRSQWVVMTDKIQTIIQLDISGHFTLPFTH